MNVIRRGSALRTPTVGAVVGHEDDERVWVVWGDAAFAPADHLDESRVEQLNELVPVR